MLTGKGGSRLMVRALDSVSFGMIWFSAPAVFPACLLKRDRRFVFLEPIYSDGDHRTCRRHRKKAPQTGKNVV